MIIKRILLTFNRFIVKYSIPLSLFMIYILLTYKLEVNNCILKNLTGMPCPGCGMTRAGIALLHFDFVGAFNYNPMIFLLPIIAIVLIFKEYKFIALLNNSKIFWVLMLAILVVTFVLRMIYVYPNVPLDYNEHNLLSIVISWFNR